MCSQCATTLGQKVCVRVYLCLQFIVMLEQRKWCVCVCMCVRSGSCAAIWDLGPEAVIRGHFQMALPLPPTLPPCSQKMDSQCDCAVFYSTASPVCVCAASPEASPALSESSGDIQSVLQIASISIQQIKEGQLAKIACSTNSITTYT